MHRNPPTWLKWQTSLIIVIHCYIRRLWGFFNPTKILRFQRGSVVFRCHSLSRHSNKQPPSCELLRLEIRSRCFFQIEHSSVFIALPWSLISRNSSEFFCILPLPWGFNMFFFVYNANQKRVHTCMVQVEVWAGFPKVFEPKKARDTESKPRPRLRQELQLRPRLLESCNTNGSLDRNLIWNASDVAHGNQSSLCFRIAFLMAASWV